MSASDASRELLRAASLRVTDGRLALLDQMATSAGPVSLDEMLELCGDAAGDRATVYRNLQAFSRVGLISLVRGLGKRDLYEIASRHADHPEHAHAVCVECGRVECVDVHGKLPATPAQSGWGPITASLTYWGVCGECRE